MAAIFSNASSMAIGMILMFNQFQSIISKNSMKTDIHNSKLKVKLGRNIHVHHTIKGNNFGNLFFYSFHSFLLHFEVKNSIWFSAKPMTFSLVSALVVLKHAILMF